MRVLFVCLGNICRSPTAEAVFRKKAKDRGLDVTTDSCGTAAYHVGDPPDRRSAAAAKARGYPIDDLRGRQVAQSDFDAFDLLLAMDDDNVRNLQAIAPASAAPKIKLFLSFATNAETDEVPDPYYGGDQGFEHVLDLVEDASEGLLNFIERQR